MPGDFGVLTALLREVSRQAGPFQSLIHDHTLEVMNDPETHGLFKTRLEGDPAMRRRVQRLKSLFRASIESSGPSPAGGADEISSAMKEVLEAASALAASSHTNLEEIADAVAVELAYRRIDQRIDEPLPSPEGLPGKG